MRFDAYYHDPFAPDANPDCWTTDCFVWAKALMKPDAILATYGASSAARRAMRDAGLFVASLPGAPGKREMTIASPHREQLAHAKAWGER